MHLLPRAPRRLFLAAALAAVGARAQEVAPFAWPWEVDFARIREAMEHTNFRLEQVRRVLDRRAGARVGKWIGLRESLIHAGASSDMPERFYLDLLGVEHRRLSSAELRRRRRLFREQAGFLFHDQSFAVTDPDRAERSYALLFVDGAVRIGRPVYRFVVYPRLPGRSAWLLDLDLATGYPLYRGEYESEHGDLVSEIEVTRFEPTRDAPESAQGWWRPRMGVREESSAAAALARAGVPKAIEPAAGILPAGYGFERARVVTDLVTGTKRAVLVFTDGIDRLFVAEARSDRKPLGGGHAIAVYRDMGLTQCLFVEAGTEYLVMGRAAESVVRTAAQSLYARALR